MKQRSKKMAWAIAGVTTILTFYALSLKLESAAGLIFGAGIPSAVALYTSKQYNDRKRLELNVEGNNNG